MGNSNSTRSDAFEKKVEKELREWEVDMYTNNRYLYIIPPKVKEEKRKEIRKRLAGLDVSWIV